MATPDVTTQMLDPDAAPEVARLPIDHKTLEHVVRAAAAGDTDAWTALVDRFRRRIHAVARAHRLAYDDAEDVEQITWLRLFEHIDRVREPEHLGGWLQTTAQRESCRVLRHRAREVPSGEELDLGSHEPPLIDALVAAERAVALSAALETATQRERVLIGALIADPPVSYRDVAHAAGIPVGSIGPTRKRCIERLRRNERLAAAVVG